MLRLTPKNHVIRFAKKLPQHQLPSSGPKLADEKRIEYHPSSWNKNNPDFDKKTKKYLLPEEVMPSGKITDPMDDPITAYNGAFDNYVVMSGGDYRVSSTSFVDLPAYARLKDERRTPITRQMKGHTYMRAYNLSKDNRLFGYEKSRYNEYTADRKKWFSRKAYDSQYGFYN